MTNLCWELQQSATFAHIIKVSLRTFANKLCQTNLVLQDRALTSSNSLKIPIRSSALLPLILNSDIDHEQDVLLQQ